MHEIRISPDSIAKVSCRTGRQHPYDTLDPRKAALVVIDMQNHFMAPGFMAETPTAREVVPNVNRLAQALRDMGGHVVWIQNVTTGTRESWSTYHEFLQMPERAAKRYASMEDGAEGHKLWPGLEVLPEDACMNKRRYSAFLQGSSDIERHLRARGIDTVMVVGVATQVCCESTARDACMLNFKTLMISDACATDSDELHNASLNAFYQNFGDVQSVEEVIASLQRGLEAEKAVA